MRFVGVLSTFTSSMIWVLVKMCLDVDCVNEEFCVIVIEVM